jgi:F-type H+-transporting ATPase subunit b
MNIGFTLVLQALGFFIFMFFTVKFVMPPLANAIEARRKQIADGLAEAEKGKASLVTAQREGEKMIAEAKAKAGEIIANAEKQAATRIEASKGEAVAEGEKQLAAAKSEMDQLVFKAKEGLRNQVSDLAVAGASKILRREVNPQVHSDLLKQLQAEL